ncbi:hypothetical protein Q8F55_004070 [Vanrija albida]|uniref:MARVEL domain-containing protein n=1 Tax=Vanrija albida TaxID=181172 RepID=A0ABR3Q641_9TREE
MMSRFNRWIVMAACALAAGICGGLGGWSALVVARDDSTSSLFVMEIITATLMFLAIPFFVGAFAHAAMKKQRASPALQLGTLVLGVAPALFHIIVRFVGRAQMTFRCRLEPVYDQTQSLPKMVEQLDPATRRGCQAAWAQQTAGVVIGCVVLVACTIYVVAYYRSCDAAYEAHKRTVAYGILTYRQHARREHRRRTQEAHAMAQAMAQAHADATLPYPPAAGVSAGGPASWAQGGKESLAGWSPPPSYDHTGEWSEEKGKGDEAQPRPSQVGLAF